MNRFYRVLSDSYIFVMIIALAAGLFMPAAAHLTPWNTQILQAIFFLSCLKIDLGQLRGSLKDWRFLLLANVLMLVAFPVVVWVTMNPFAPNLGLALFLLAAMPVGMTTPLLVDVVGGKQTIAMVLTVTTSLLAPITIPLLTKILYGATIAVDAFGMFKQLSLVIFLPFILALIVRTIVASTVEAIKTTTKPISILLLGLLIAGAIAKQSAHIRAMSQDLPRLFLIIVALYLFFCALHLAGYYAFWWKKREDKLTASVALTYMNFTLAIFLASQFFPTPEVLLPLVLAILPWATLLPVWKWVARTKLR